MKICATAMMAWLLVIPGMAMAQSADPEAHYQQLLAEAKAATGSVDWRALRYAYAGRPAFTGNQDDDADRDAMFKAANSGDWQAAQAAAQRAVDTMYVDGMAHIMLAVAYDHLGKTAEADREGPIGQGLLDSIETGDGLSYGTAWTVITVAEEYDFLYYIGLKPGQQSLSEHDGHMFDVLEAADDKGNSTTYYFNIDREWDAEARMFDAMGLGNGKTGQQ
jgi:hypothetical protein